MPILKQLVSNSNQSKRRSRADLTAEMISAPLGDFRHTMHVGRGGDAFGDTSFLSTRSGEPPRDQTTSSSSSMPPPADHYHNNKEDTGSSKPGLLSRTFRSSKRTQSVNRGGDNKYDSNLILPSTAGTASSYVKNAISLPYLNDEDAGRGVRLAKSVSSSPMRKPSEVDGVSNKPANGGGAAMASMATLDAEFDEHNFGELTELPPSSAATRGGGGMKHAESIMSFHIDLGPSMLGDILSVMEKKGWEDDDLGYEEGKGSEGRASPSLSPPAEENHHHRDASPPARPPRSMAYQKTTAVPVDEPYTPELRVRTTTTNNTSTNHHQYLDSCSVSSAGSEDQKAMHLHHQHHHHNNNNDTDSAKYSSPRGDDDRDFSFMDDDDDEIRV